MPTPALVVDRTGVILTANRCMIERLQSHSGARSCVGERICRIFARDAEYLMTDLRSAASGGRLIVWLRGASAHGSGRMCFQVTAIPGHTRQAEHFLLVEDRTKPINRVFSELNLRLRQANEEAAETHRKHRQLKANYKVLEQFSMVAAHDLKAPLLNISLLLEFLQEEYGAILDGPAQDLLASAKESASRLQNLISALLRHARSGAADLDIRTIDVAGLVETVRQSLIADLRESGGQIRLVGDLGQVRADADLFGQLLQNILCNALKYRSPQRPPDIRVERVSAADGVEMLVISDNGRGFDPAEKDHLFEPFKRLQNGHRVEGSGVGLSICRTVCDRHGWTIDATGVPDEGATFEIAGIGRKPK